MPRLRDNLQMYWPLLLGTVLLLAAAWRYYSLGRWEENIGSAAMAVFGFVAFVAPEELSSWTGRYGWTYEDFWTYPPTYLRPFGIMTLVGVLLFGFRG